MSSYAVIHRYDPDGVQTKGFVKLLSSLQAYEQALEDFEEQVEKEYQRQLLQIPEPTWWQKCRGTNLILLEMQTNPTFLAARSLDRMVAEHTYKAKLDWWQSDERKAFNGKMDMARWYARYSQLRSLIRCGLTFHLDGPMTKFVNEWGNRYDCFK